MVLSDEWSALTAASITFGRSPDWSITSFFLAVSGCDGDLLACDAKAPPYFDAMRYRARIVTHIEPERPNDEEIHCNTLSPRMRET